MMSSRGGNGPRGPGVSVSIEPVSVCDAHNVLSSSSVRASECIMLLWFQGLYARSGDQSDRDENGL